MQKVEIKLIDYKVAKAQKKKTVDRSTERNNVFIQSWKENGKNKNIPKLQITGYKSRNLRLPKKAMTKVLKRVNWTPL